MSTAVLTAQLTPPHSPCSVAFGIGLTTDTPGGAPGRGGAAANRYMDEVKHVAAR